MVTQTSDVECFQLFVGMITNDARFTQDIKSRSAVENATFIKKKSLFTSELDFEVKEGASEVGCSLLTEIYWYETLTL